MVHNETILKATDDLNSQKTPNVKTTGKKYNVTYSTLQHCFNSKTIFYNKIHSKSIMFFTNAQKSIFIEHINELSVRGLHPILQMLENFVVKIISYLIKS